MLIARGLVVKAQRVYFVALIGLKIFSSAEWHFVHLVFPFTTSVKKEELRKSQEQAKIANSYEEKHK